MKCLDDFRLKLGGREFVPLMVGGMGVDISTSDLALEAARLGGIGHISDAMVPTISDRRYDTRYVAAKMKKYKSNVGNDDKSVAQFDLGELADKGRREGWEKVGLLEYGSTLSDLERQMDHGRDPLRPRQIMNR